MYYLYRLTKDEINIFIFKSVCIPYRSSIHSDKIACFKNNTLPDELQVTRISIQKISVTVY